MIKPSQALEDLIDLLENEHLDLSKDAYVTKRKAAIRSTLDLIDIVLELVDLKVEEIQGQYYIMTGDNYRGAKKITKKQYESFKELLWKKN